MAAQTLNQVMKSLNSTYSPQVKLLQQRQAGIPQALQADEQALGAKQTQAYEDILGGARRRGIAFSGIPLAEQAKYASTDYLPALARLKQSGREQAMGLEESILGVRERQTTLAQQIREGALSRAMARRQMDEEKRQFNLNYKLAQRTAGSGGGGGGGSFSPSLGGGGAVSGDTNGDGKVTSADKAYSSVQKFMSQGRAAAESDYQAAYNWYKKTGNPVDKLKVQLYQKQGIGKVSQIQKGVNSGGLSSYGYSKSGSGGLSTNLKNIKFGY